MKKFFYSCLAIAFFAIVANSCDIQTSRADNFNVDFNNGWSEIHGPNMGTSVYFKNIRGNIVFILDDHGCKSICVK